MYRCPPFQGCVPVRAGERAGVRTTELQHTGHTLLAAAEGTVFNIGMLDKNNQFYVI